MLCESEPDHMRGMGLQLQQLQRGNTCQSAVWLGWWGTLGIVLLLSSSGE